MKQENRRKDKKVGHKKKTTTNNKHKIFKTIQQTSTSFKGNKRQSILTRHKYIQT